MSFRNERHLYRRRCEVSGKDLISAFSPRGGYKVVSPEVWWSGGLDSLRFGRSYDPSRSFLEQLGELTLEVPHLSLNQRNAENSDYTAFSINVKNCYLAFGATDCEGCLYGKTVSKSTDIIDGLAVRSSELCYEIVTSEKCYRSAFISNSKECTECFFVDSCEGCSNCFLCTGLYRKEYCIRNESVGKTRYEAFLREHTPLSKKAITQFIVELATLENATLCRGSSLFNCEECDGDFIYSSKNCHHTFHSIDCEDCKFLFWTPKGKNSYDCTYNAPDGVELCYEACSTLATRSMGTFWVWNSDSILYSMECVSSDHLLGCVGLHRKSHCILNREYSVEEYERLAKEIISDMKKRGEWGEYLPQKLSWFSYHESVAHEYFPLSSDEAAAKGFHWREEPAPSLEGSTLIELPESISEVSDDIVKRVLHCKRTGRAYKIMPYELRIYRELGVPLPSLCPDERHKDRLSKINPPRLWKRICAVAGEEILSAVPPDSSRTVVSNEVYLARQRN